MTKSTKSIFLLVSLIVCSGCGIEPETIAALQDAVNAAKGQANLSGSEESPQPVAAVAFTPPYPHRNDPFAFPGGFNERSETRPGESPVTDGIAVEVLGFADVGRPCVLLRIDDGTHTLRVGDRVGGVAVIAIRPPAADLRVGSQVRTVSMFDEP